MQTYINIFGQVFAIFCVFTMTFVICANRVCFFLAPPLNALLFKRPNVHFVAAAVWIIGAFDTYIFFWLVIKCTYDSMACSILGISAALKSMSLPVSRMRL